MNFIPRFVVVNARAVVDPVSVQLPGRRFIDF